MHIERILVVEDDEAMITLIREILAPICHSVECVGTLREARHALKEGSFDLILSDVILPDGNGVDLLRQLHAQKDPPAHLMMSGYGTIESATEAMREGAADYLVKPFNPDQLQVAIQRVEAWKQLTEENALLRREARESAPLAGILGASPAIREVLRLIQQIGPTDVTVLIRGESGTGKELVARALFEAGPRRNQPFIRLNCAAIPENLMESELFGHEKGAFTGAHSKRMGRFEMAHGGTLLLDEISEIPLQLQAKLLRVLQEREFERVGGSRTLSVDVRILATTNRDLKAQVEKGHFREDLYYRLNVVPIHLPSLRERPGDVDVLLDHYLRHFAAHHGKTAPAMSVAARQALRASRWPGNVRELQNCVERAVILSAPGRMLELSDFGLSAVEPVTSAVAATVGDASLSLGMMEKRFIRQALQQSGGNRTQAAKILGISTRTLQYKLKEDASLGVLKA